MRGRSNPQGAIVHYFQPDELIPAEHPLRRIKASADAALRTVGPIFTARYRERGRPSMPPEQLLKSQLLIALYSVRSDRLFCKPLRYNFLFRWFLDLEPEAAPFDASTFSQNPERLLAHEVALRFFDAVVALARRQGLLSAEHCSVDGTLIEAWASQKSLRPTGSAPRHRRTIPATRQGSAMGSAGATRRTRAARIRTPGWRARARAARRSWRMRRTSCSTTAMGCAWTWR